MAASGRVPSANPRCWDGYCHVSPWIVGNVIVCKVSEKPASLGEMGPKVQARISK
jgi:hypothetical protein